MENNKYGLLLTPDIKLHRRYFDEMVRLLGIQVEYRAPRKDKHYTSYGEIAANYEKPITIGCIFDNHPTQQTLKKMGWVAELQEDASIIHVAYDTPNIQQGALFYIPSGLDDGADRLFRVTRLTNGIVYPASITCEIVPEYYNVFNDNAYEHSSDSLNLLVEEENHQVWDAQ